MKTHIQSVFIILVTIICFSCSEREGFELGKKTEIVISGESFTLSRTRAKNFYYQCERIKSVYSYDENGNKIAYKETDYRVSRNSLSRTETSSIPDFENYTVSFNEDGKFTFIGEPRNPPLIINYVVYVDYVTYINDFQIDDKKNVLKDNNNDGEIKVLVCGDSIAAGAQTISQFYKANLDDAFSGLLREYIESQGVVCQIDNSSFVNSGISMMTYNMDSIIDNNYDVVVIEYGMNDHLTVTGGVNHTEAFVSEFRNNIRVLLGKNISVIVLGFFQQNMLWDFEDIEATKTFNVAMKNLCADYKIPFCDIYEEFEKFSVVKKDSGDVGGGGGYYV